MVLHAPLSRKCFRRSLAASVREAVSTYMRPAAVSSVSSERIECPISWMTGSLIPETKRIE